MDTLFAAPPDNAFGAAADHRPLEVLTLGFQGEVFALEAGLVREILDLPPVTEVPNALPFVGGLINVRGKVVPLADLRVVFAMECTPPTIDTRVVVIEVDLDGEPTLLGLVADKVHEVTGIAAVALKETPRIGMRWRPEFIRCIGKAGDDFVVVLDVPAILSSHLKSAAGWKAAADPRH